MTRRRKAWTPKRWTPELIKAAIRDKGKTMNQLALENGLPDCAVRNSISKPYKAAETVIAKFLDVPAAELWPERHDAQGHRLESLPTHHYKRQRRMRTDKSKVADQAETPAA